jgi:hypothetical protein
MLQIGKVVSIFKGWLKKDYNNSRPMTIITIFETKIEKKKKKNKFVTQSRTGFTNL